MNYFNKNKDNYKIRVFIVWLILGNLSILTNQVSGSVDNFLQAVSAPQDTVVIDFDKGEFTAGDLVSEINYPNGKIKVFGSNSDFPGQNTAMIFNSGNPTGGDLDLGTPNEFFGGPGINFDGGAVESNSVPFNNVLIVSEDLNSAEPDDATAEDISFTFDFSSPVTLLYFNLLDLDSGEATLLLFDSLGNEIFSMNIPETGDNGVATVALNVVNVAQMHVDLNGSGAIDNITFVSDDELNDVPGNSAPLANNDTFNTSVDTPLNVDPPGVLDNDSDPDGDILTIIAHDTTTVKGGTVELNPDGSFTYSPPDGFSGLDSFTYSVSDGNGTSATATVTVAVKDPANNDPSAGDDVFSTDVDTQLIVDSPGVLGNDIDEDGDSLTIISYDTTTASGGTVVLDPDGGFTYDPPDGFEGDDTFNYVISDDRGGADTASVTVAVILGATAPVANSDVYATNINTVLTIEAPGVLENDTDPNGDALSVIGFDATGSNGGTVELNSDGSFTFTPATDSIGIDTFYYIVSDGNGNTDTALVFINIIVPGVGSSGNSAPIAVADTVMTDLDLELVVTDPQEGILSNDSDPDGDDIAALEVSNAITDQGGSISIMADGTYSYRPRLGFVGVDTYEYTICDDADLQLCDTAIISIEVKELPVKVFDAFSPNGDGINDFWVIQGITRFPNNHVQIFNRWGNLVYQVRGYDNTANVWQGQVTEGVVFGKKEVPDGGYFYVINLGDGSKTISGFVIVRR